MGPDRQQQLRAVPGSAFALQTGMFVGQAGQLGEQCLNYRKNNRHHAGEESCLDVSMIESLCDFSTLAIM